MLLTTLHSFISKQGFKRGYCVGFSGGLDSQVLLHLCVALRAQHDFPLRALHVHHGLSPYADAWLAHCKSICEHYGVDFESHALTIKPVSGESIEEFARKHRYQYLEQALKPEEVLLTAHHEDDQAETLLLQLLRGAGPKGLSSMPKIKPSGLGYHGRPLLAVTRAALKEYAELYELLWIEDELNDDLHYSRNFIRHEILPLLKKRWPTVTASIARSAGHCAEAQQVLDDLANQELKHLQGTVENTVSVKTLLDLPEPRQRLMLRIWMEEQGYTMPSSVKLQQILSDVLWAKWDATPCVNWGQVELRRYQDDLYLMKALAEHDVKRSYEWDLKSPLEMEGIGKLEALPVQGKGLKMTTDKVAVRFRQGGEVYALAKGNHHELKKFFQEKNIPTWLRDRLPLITIDDELAAVPGYLIVDKFKAKLGEEGYELRMTSLLFM